MESDTKVSKVENTTRKEKIYLLIRKSLCRAETCFLTENVKEYAERKGETDICQRQRQLKRTEYSECFLAQNEASLSNKKMYKRPSVTPA